MQKFQSEQKQQAGRLEHVIKTQTGLSDTPDWQYTGQFSDAELDTHLGSVLQHSAAGPLGLQRKVRAVFIELFQNICRHGAVADGRPHPCGMMAIWSCAEPNSHSVRFSAANFLTEQGVELMQPVLDEFGLYGYSQLRTRYRQQLLHPTSQSQRRNSAGLGLLDMARRSEGKLNIELDISPPAEPVFSITVTVTEFHAMTSFHRLPTSRTPEVRFDPGTGHLSLKGESYPEDITKFYGELEQILKDYISSQPSHLNAEFELNYFNSGSARALLELVQYLNGAAQKGIEVDINWSCDEEDDIGTEFATDLSRNAPDVSFSVNNQRQKQ